MNDIYRTPLLTFWPDPFSAKNLKELFSSKQKIKRKVKNKVKELSSFSYFFNLLSTSY